MSASPELGRAPGPQHCGREAGKGRMDFYFPPTTSLRGVRRIGIRLAEHLTQLNEHRFLLLLVGTRYDSLGVIKTKTKNRHNGFELSTRFLCFHLTSVPFNLSEV